MTQQQLDIVAEILHLRRGCAIHNMTFINTDAELSLTDKERQSLARVQHRRFLEWWDSWVVPLLKDLEQKT